MHRVHSTFLSSSDESINSFQTDVQLATVNNLLLAGTDRATSWPEKKRGLTSLLVRTVGICKSAREICQAVYLPEMVKQIAYVA